MTRDSATAAVSTTHLKVVECSCCGEAVPNTKKHNVAFGTGKCDTGFGQCRKCFGDPKAQTFKEKIGWGLQMFYEARFDVIREKLNETNRQKWDKLSYERKCYFIAGLVEEGKMI